MKFKTLGKTGLFVSKLCLGTMTFGGKGFWEVIGHLDQDQEVSRLPSEYPQWMIARQARGREPGEQVDFEKVK